MSGMVPALNAMSSGSARGSADQVPHILRTDPMSEGFSQEQKLPSQEMDTTNPHVPKFSMDTVNFDSALDKLGEGSFGVCYKVKQTVLGTCVMKIPQQNHLQLGSTKDALFQQRREFLHCVMLNHHPNIVSFYGYVHKSGHPNEPDGFLMEFMQGGNLFNYLQHDQPMLEVLNGWAKQIAQGLSFMHHRGIMHRDLNPNNILLSRDRLVAKISDFGLAKKVETADSTYKHTVKVGTAIYRAPEVFVDNKYHYPVDVYSYGMTLYFIYYRRLPFEGNFFDKMSAFKAQQKLSGAEGKVPIRPELGILGNCLEVQDQLIEKCWESDPDKRPTIATVVHWFDLNPDHLPTYDI